MQVGPAAFKLKLRNSFFYGIIQQLDCNIITLNGEPIKCEKVNINFGAKNLSGNSGLVPIAQFAEKLKIEEVLESELSIKQKANGRYSIVEVIMLTMFGVIAGAKHISQLDIIRHDSVIMRLLNWGAFPVTTTI